MGEQYNINFKTFYTIELTVRYSSVWNEMSDFSNLIKIQKKKLNIKGKKIF